MMRPKQVWYISFALGSYLLTLAWAQNADIDDLFTIATTGGGACSVAQQNTLVKWWKDVYEMLEAVQVAYNNYATDESARQMFMQYFGIQWDKTDPTTITDSASQTQLIDVMAVFNNLQNFMNTGQIDFDEEISNYWIFCDSLFLEYAAWGTPAKDTTGSDDEDTNDNAELLEDVEEYQKYKNNGLYPFWYGDPGPGDYMFIDRTTTYCALKGSLGVTTEEYEPYSITICPSVFDSTPGTIADATQPALGSLVERLTTASSTLLHEMMHAIYTNEETPDNAYGVSACQKLATSGKLSATAKLTVVNPDSFTYFAMAYKYRLKDWGTDGAPIYLDFSTSKVAVGTAPP